MIHFKILLPLLFSILFIGCSSKPKEPFVLSTTIWIGYSPLYYAEKKGWLRENNIKFVNTTSIHESLKMYMNNSIHAFASTQYGFNKMQKLKNEKANIILLNLSLGGDVILSNRTIDELKNSSNITAYLEVDSINSTILNYFMTKYEIDSSQITKVNMNQHLSSKLDMKNDPAIIMTFSPYDIHLRNHGYEEIASSSDPDLFIVDGVYIAQKDKSKFHHEINSLNRLIAKSLNALKNDPIEFFDTIKSYYGYKNFDEFHDALNSIKWIYEHKSEDLLKRLESIDIDPTMLMAPHIKQ